MESVGNDKSWKRNPRWSFLYTFLSKALLRLPAEFFCHFSLCLVFFLPVNCFPLPRCLEQLVHLRPSCRVEVFALRCGCARQPGRLGGDFRAVGGDVGERREGVDVPLVAHPALEVDGAAVDGAARVVELARVAAHEEEVAAHLLVVHIHIPTRKAGFDDGQVCGRERGRERGEES